MYTTSYQQQGTPMMLSQHQTSATPMQQHVTTVQEQRSISIPRNPDGSIIVTGPSGVTTTTTEYTTSPVRVQGATYQTGTYQSGAPSYHTGPYQTGYAIAGSNYGASNYGAPTVTTGGGAASIVGGSGYGTGAVASSTYGAESSYYTTGGSRVVYGQERVISVNQRVDESRSHIVGERFIEHTVRVPKKITREDIIEKVIIVPEKVLNEEYIEELATVKEKIIEVAKPMIIEKVIEVPEIEYVDKIVEKTEVIVQEKEKRVDKVIYEERIREVPKIIQQEKVVEIPEITYRDVPVQRVVDVPEIREEIMWVDMPVDQHVPKPEPVLVQDEKFVDIERQIPIPVEANTVYEYRLPTMRPRYNKVTYPVYLPRFVEIPVAVELLNAGLISQAESQLQQINKLKTGAVSLCEIENIANQINRADLHNKIPTMDLQTAVLRAWQEGTLQIGAEGGVTTTVTTTTTGPGMQTIAPLMVQ